MNEYDPDFAAARYYNAQSRSEIYRRVMVDYERAMIEITELERESELGLEEADREERLRSEHEMLAAINA